MDLKLIIFLIINFFIFAFNPFIVKSNEYKPYAIVVGLSKDPIPLISEQILLKKLRDELAKTYDLRFQSKFEIALQKIKDSTDYKACEKIKCIMQAYSGFEQTDLLLFKILKPTRSMTIMMIGKNQRWIVKHEICSNCGLSQEEMIKNIVFKLGNYSTKNIALDKRKLRTMPISSEVQLKKYKNLIKGKKEFKKNLLETEITYGTNSSLNEKKSPLDKLQFKISQRQYNHLIWKKIKKGLMFFRRKNMSYSIKNLKARLKLHIDKFGRVIEKSLVIRSGSKKFDKTILDTVDVLKLPPPMKNLIVDPPYVVTILIQP